MRLSLLAVVVVLAVTGCTSKDDVRGGREQALALVGQYAPQLAAHRAAIDGLQVRLRKVPAGTAGVAELTATLERALTAIAAAQAVVDQVPARAAEAATRGRAGELRRLTVDTAEAVAAQLITIGNDVDDVTLAVGALEAKVAAAAAIDAGPGDAAPPLDAR